LTADTTAPSTDRAASTTSSNKVGSRDDDISSKVGSRPTTSSSKVGSRDDGISEEGRQYGRRHLRVRSAAVTTASPRRVGSIDDDIFE